MIIQDFSSLELSEAQVKMINHLTEKTWPESKLAEKSHSEQLASFLNRNPGKTCHLIIEQTELQGYAESFPRKIHVEGTPLTIMGLATVCVQEHHRGKGLGLALVERALARIDSDEFPVAMFQTGVPEFYLKMGCEIVHNRFIDSQNPHEPDKNPFWDDCVMTYTKDYNWPTGEVDILGPGF